MTHPLSSTFPLPSRQPELPVSQQTHALVCRLRKLSRKAQQVFLLSRLDQLSYTSVAQWLELDVSAVERKMVRVLDHCSEASDASAEQARRWYVHLQSPHATPSQRIEFRHWLDASAQHLNAFEETERLWRALETPAAILGANGWHRRKRRAYIAWLMLTAFLCSLLVTAEAFT